jgi:hypothetical protein
MDLFYHPVNIQSKQTHYRQLNPNGNVVIRPSLDTSTTFPNRKHSIASTSSSTTITGGIDIPIQPLGNYRARRATIEVETDSDTEELSSRKRRTPQQISMASSSSNDAAYRQRPPRPQSYKNKSVGMNQPSTTNFPVYQRHRSKSRSKEKHGDTIV